MLEVKIPADIQEYKSKLIAGFSTRQFLSLAGALAVGVPIGVLGHDYISGEILPWIVIITVVPILAWGFIKFQGMQFEEYAKRVFALSFLPQRRVYEDTDDNLFIGLHGEITEAALAQERIEKEEMEWRESH